MGINQHNYEAFFLDYTEGNLSVEMTAELLLFLEKNPSIKEELEGFELIELSSENEVLSDKNALKVHINKNNLEDYIIGSIEGVNSKNDEEDLARFIAKNSQSAILLNRYKKTILSPTTVVFPTKNRLKKKNRVVYLYPLLGVAASLLLFFMLSYEKTAKTYNPQTIIAIENTFLEEENNNYVAVILEKSLSNTNPKELLVKKISKKDSVQNSIPEPNNVALVIDKIDSTIVDVSQEEAPPIAVVVNSDSLASPEQQDESLQTEIANNEFTINEWANKQIRKKVFKQDTESTSKIEKDEVFDALANGLNKISKQEITYNSLTSETTVTKGFSIGNFEFSRTKRKKNKT